jgi:hypothetical protein
MAVTCRLSCVRRAWLWGRDEFAGREYSHRKQWVMDRLAQLSEVLAIEICAYAAISSGLLICRFSS